MKYKISAVLFALSFSSVFIALGAEEEKLQVIEVKQGDTLSKISKKSLEDPSQWPALLKYNKVANPNLIQPGMKLKVPANLGKKPAAVVIYKSGKAQYARAQENTWKEIMIKLGLYSEDQVKTGPLSTVHLQLSNMTILRLQPETFIIVNKVDKSGKETIFTLQEGRLQAQVENMRKSGGQLAIRTPSAVAASSVRDGTTSTARAPRLRAARCVAFLMLAVPTTSSARRNSSRRSRN